MLALVLRPALRVPSLRVSSSLRRCKFVGGLDVGGSGVGRSGSDSSGLAGTEHVALMPRIHVYGRTEAAMQGELRIELPQLDPHRQTLHYLDPVARRVLRGKQRELRARARADTHDPALEFLARVTIHMHIGRLTDAHVRKLVFLEIGFDPDVTGDYQGEHRRRSADVGSNLKLLDSGDNPVAGCPDDRIGQIQLRAVEQCLRLLNHRVTVRRDVGVTTQVGDDRTDLLFRGCQLGTRAVEGMNGAINLQLR